MPLPAGFRFGVGLSGFGVEGGYNGAGQPANNWRDWDRSGRSSPSGRALDFRNRYPEVLDRAAAAGCDAVRLSVEWARCEPAPGQVDEDAFVRCRAILEACQERGLEPVVALHELTWPHWLGPDFWLELTSPDRYAAWVALAADRLSGVCRHWITIDGINVAGPAAYFAGRLPPGRIGRTGDAVRASGHLLVAHVLGERTIRRRQPDAVVAAGTVATCVYELDRLPVDVLIARGHGVARLDLGPWLAERRRAYYGSLPKPAAAERAVRRAAASALPLDQAVPRAVSEVYQGSRILPLDALHVRYADPRTLRWLVPAGGRRDRDSVDPDGLGAYCLRPAQPEPELELWVTSGLSHPVVAGQPLPRHDGWDRVRFLSAILTAVSAAVEEGTCITRFFHHTLGDSYECGSYQRRYGLFAVDHRTGAWSDRDSFGGDAAGTYRRLIEELRPDGPQLPRR